MNDAKEQVVAPLLLTVCPEQQGEQQGSPLFNFSIKEVSRNQLWFVCGCSFDPRYRATGFSLSCAVKHFNTHCYYLEYKRHNAGHVGPRRRKRKDCRFCQGSPAPAESQMI